MVPEVGAGPALGRQRRLASPQLADLLDLPAPGVQGLELDAIHAGHLPRPPERFPFRQRLLHLDDLQVDPGAVAALPLHLQEAADVGRGALEVGVAADGLVGLRLQAVEAEEDGIQPGLQNLPPDLLLQQRGVGADGATQPPLGAGADHVHQARVEQRLAPDVQRGRRHVRGHLVHDAGEKAKVHVPSGPLKLAPPLRAHDAAQVADVGGFDVHAVGIGHAAGLAALVGQPLDGPQRLAPVVAQLELRLLLPGHRAGI